MPSLKQLSFIVPRAVCRLGESWLMETGFCWDSCADLGWAGSHACGHLALADGGWAWPRRFEGPGLLHQAPRPPWPSRLLGTWFVQCNGRGTREPAKAHEICSSHAQNGPTGMFTHMPLAKAKTWLLPKPRTGWYTLPMTRLCQRYG